MGKVLRKGSVITIHVVGGDVLSGRILGLEVACQDESVDGFITLLQQASDTTSTRSFGVERVPCIDIAYIE